MQNCCEGHKKGEAMQNVVLASQKNKTKQKPKNPNDFQFVALKWKEFEFLMPKGEFCQRIL